MPELEIAAPSRSWRIIFMGTPGFAVPTLRALIEGPDEVVAVVAQPDKPARRGRKLHSPPTARLARSLDIPVLQPRKVRGPSFVNALREFAPDLVVVAAYGRILVEQVLQAPRFGCVNVHASLLPRYRGASPIQWALMRGETVTGITTMMMDPGLDTGDILLVREHPIAPRTNAGQLHDELAEIGAALLLETVAGLQRGTIVPTPQDHSKATMAPLLKKEDGLVDWTAPATRISGHVYGMTPWPGAFTFLHGKRMTLLEGTPLEDRFAAPPGAIVEVSGAGISVATGDGTYRIERLKPECSKVMKAEAYLCGHPVTTTDHFSNGPESP